MQQFGLYGVLGMVSGVLMLLMSLILALGVDANQYSLEAASPDEDALDRGARLWSRRRSTMNLR